jgi:hypothetical protein
LDEENKVYDTSHNIFWMKKNKVYADLGQQKWFWADINAHNKSISTKMFLTSKF